MSTHRGSDARSDCALAVPSLGRGLVHLPRLLRRKLESRKSIQQAREAQRALDDSSPRKVVFVVVSDRKLDIF